MVQQVVGVAVVEEEALPEAHEEVLERGVPQLSPDLVPVERLGEAPAGVHPGRRTQPTLRLLGVPALLPLRVCGQRGAHAFEEDLDSVWQHQGRAPLI